MIKHSPLAKAIATTYTSISTSRIAHITLTPHLTFSLQIPIPTSISTLPTPTEPQLPGLWLTTATSIPPSPSPQPPSNLASHFALLLLSDLPTIMYVSSPSSLSVDPGASHNLSFYPLPTPDANDHYPSPQRRHQHHLFPPHRPSNPLPPGQHPHTILRADRPPDLHPPPGDPPPRLASHLLAPCACHPPAPHP